jgi:hypothetical protein
MVSNTYDPIYLRGEIEGSCSEVSPRQKAEGRGGRVGRGGELGM